jgi:hypothetical protein
MVEQFCNRYGGFLSSSVHVVLEIEWRLIVKNTLRSLGLGGLKNFLAANWL